MEASPLLRLSSSNLREIAEALESGRLEGLSTLALAAWAPPADREPLARFFNELRQGGLTGSSLVLALRLLADQRTFLEAERSSPELVWTGPKSSGSASRDTATVARQLFAKARRTVLVATFALYEGKSIFRALAERMDEIPGQPVVEVRELVGTKVKRWVASGSPPGASRRQTELEPWPSEGSSKLDHAGRLALVA